MSTNEHTPTLLQPIPQDMKRGWALYVNGKEIPIVAYAEIRHPKFGSVFYGKSPSGNYDQWSFHEAGGGGSVTVPFTIVEESLYIGVVEQTRPLQERVNPVLNVPRGFLDPGETHFQAAVREGSEEFGIPASFTLPGDPTNPNSTFFETWGEDEGVHFFGLEVNQNILVADGNEYRLDPKIVEPVSKSAEGIMGAKFIPWQDAALLGDLFTRGAVAAVLTYLHSADRMTVSFS